MYPNMKTYSDLQDIDLQLICKLHLEPVGCPEVSIRIGNQIFSTCKLFKNISLDTQFDLIEPFQIEIELKNKKYESTTETAVIIKCLQIDNIDLVPQFDYLATYINDHNNNNPTSYLGFNGSWTLTFDRPFYQWLHQVTGQGWLLS